MMIQAKGECPVCHEYSEIGFIRRADGVLLLLCGECGWIWDDPAKIVSEEASEGETTGIVSWATREEIVARGWGGYIREERKDP